MITSEIISNIRKGETRAIARAISYIENCDSRADEILEALCVKENEKQIVIGITGPPGAGKSTLTSALIEEFRGDDLKVAILAVDPTSPISGGAILGDRIRMMKFALDQKVYMRSMATRGRLGGLCAAASAVTRLLKAAGFDCVIIETVGIGQSEMDIVKLADLTLLVCAPGLGDDVQAMKAGILEVSDLFVLNKKDLPGHHENVRLMNELIHETNKKLIETNAVIGEGVAALKSAIFETFQEKVNSGTQLKLKTKARELEIFDWVVEHLRTHIEDQVLKSSKNSEPKIIAKNIAHNLLIEVKKGDLP